MKKAIRITSLNKNSLEAQYEMDKGYLELSSGMYLVSDFGESKSFIVLTPARYKMQYNEVGEIKNGYTNVMPKELVA